MADSIDLFAGSTGLDAAVPVAGADLFADPNKPGAFKRGLGAGIAGVRSSLWGAGALLARGATAVLPDAVAPITTGLEAAALENVKTQNDLAASQSMSFEDVLADPTRAGEFAKWALGSAAPSIALMAVGGGLGALAGRALGLSTKVGALAGAVAPDVAVEAGSIYPEALKTGVENPGLRSAVGGAAAGAIDFLTVPAAFRGITAVTKATKAGPGAMVREILTRVPKVGGAEAAQELTQTIIERTAAGQDMTSPEAVQDYIQSALVGGIAGAALGGVAGAVHGATASSATIDNTTGQLVEPPVVAPNPGAIDPTLGTPLPTSTPAEMGDYWGAQYLAATDQLAALEPQVATAQQVHDALVAKREALTAEAALPVGERRAKSEILTERKVVNKELEVAKKQMETLGGQLHSTRATVADLEPRLEASARQVVGEAPVTEGLNPAIAPKTDPLVSTTIADPNAPVVPEHEQIKRAVTGVQTLMRERGMLHDLPASKLSSGTEQTPRELALAREGRREVVSKDVSSEQMKAVEDHAMTVIEPLAMTLAKTKTETPGGQAKIAKAMTATMRGVVQEAAKQSSVEAAQQYITDKLPNALKGHGVAVDAADMAKAVSAAVGQAKTQYSKGAVETPEFKKWFGTSKVVDEKGAPLTLYHGTSADVSQLTLGDDGGIHLGTSAQANARLKIVAKNKTYVGGVPAEISKQGQNVIPVHAAIQNPRRVQDFGGDVSAWNEAIYLAKAQGFDGLVYRNKFEAPSTRKDSYVAFYPEQVKSIFESNAALTQDEFDTLPEPAKFAAVDEFNRVMRDKGTALRERLTQLIGNDPALKVSTFMATPDSPIGSYTRVGPLKSVITLALNAKDELSVADHEGYHYAEDRLLDARERRIVANGMKPGRPLFNQLVAKLQVYDQTNKTNLTDEVTAVPAEARAYAFEFWRRGELQADGPIARAWQKLQQFLERVANLVRGDGFVSLEDVFTALDRGQFAERMVGTEGAGDVAFAHAAWHGTPHVWVPEPGFPHGRPRLDKIGTGEGAQSYGWGWYSADVDTVARTYQNGIDLGGGAASSPKALVERLSAETGTRDAAKIWDTFRARVAQGFGQRFGTIFTAAVDQIKSSQDVQNLLDEKPQGSLYKLDIPDDVLSKLMDWNKPISQQSEYVKNVLRKEFGESSLKTSELYRQLAGDRKKRGQGGYGTDDEAASKHLASIGIPGNKYTDAMSRNDGARAAHELYPDKYPPAPPPTYNYVIWDQKVLDRIALLERNGEKLDAMRGVDTQFSQAAIDTPKKYQPPLSDEFKRELARDPEARRQFEEWRKANEFWRGLRENNMGTQFSRGAVAEMTTRFQNGELERVQEFNAFTKLHDDAMLHKNDTLKRVLLGPLADNMAGSISRWWQENIATPNYVSHLSQGFKNVYKTLNTYIRYRETLIEKMLRQQMPEWYHAHFADQDAAFAALLKRTVEKYTTDSAEYRDLYASLTDEQKKLFDGATRMIAGFLDAELAVDTKDYKTFLITPGAYEKWLADRTAQVDEMKRTGYVPLRRYGDHTVAVQRASMDANGKPQQLTVALEMFTSERQALVAAEIYKDEFKRQGVPYSVEVGYKHKTTRDTTVSVQQFLDTARRNGVEVSATERERLVLALSASDAMVRNRMMRREGMPGFSKDGMRVLNEFGVNMSGKIAYAKFGVAIDSAADGRAVTSDVVNGEPVIDIDGPHMNDDGSWAETSDAFEARNLWKQDGPKSGFYRNQADALSDYVLVPDNTGGWSRNLRGAAMMYFIGGSISGAMVNTMSVPMLLVPELSIHTGYANALATSLGAWKQTWQHQGILRDITRLKDKDANPMPEIDKVPGLRDAIIAATDKLHDTELHQIMSISQGQFFSQSRKVQRAIEVWMAPFRISEQTNRITSFISGFKIGRENGLSGPALFNFARDMVDSTQNNYSQANRPGAARNPVWAMAMMFKSFPLFMTEAIALMYKANPKSAVFMLLGLVALTGVQGLPFAETIEDLIDTIAQRIFNSPFNTRRAMRNVIKSASEAVVGYDMSELVLRGVINDMVGMSVSSRIGAGDFVPGTRLGTADADKGKILTEFLGAPITMVKDAAANVGKFAGGAFTGDWKEVADALRAGGPIAARNVIKGAQQLSDGYASDAKGRKIMDVSTPAALWQMAGVASAGVAKMYEFESINIQTRAYYTQFSQDLQAQLVAAMKSGDTEKVQEVNDLRAAWNVQYPQMQIMPNPAATRRAIILSGVPLDQRSRMLWGRRFGGANIFTEEAGQ